MGVLFIQACHVKDLDIITPKNQEDKTGEWPHLE